jgi:hypothetical protein
MSCFAVGGDADPGQRTGRGEIPDARWKEAADAALKLKEVAAN